MYASMIWGSKEPLFSMQIKSLETKRNNIIQLLKYH